MRESFPGNRKIPERESDKKQAAEAFVGPWDKDMLEQGVKNITFKMLKDFGGTLPEVIILPETSARPLAYVLKPVFKMLQEHKQIPMPKLYFFNSRPSSVSLQLHEKISSEEKGSAVTFDTSDELAAYLHEIGYDEEDIRYEIDHAGVEEMKRSRDVMEARAEEIRSFAPDADIAVIDEFASNGTTTQEVRRAFKDPNLPVYAVFSNYYVENVSMGVPIDVADGNSLNPRRDFAAKLSYSGEKAVGVRKNTADLEKYATAIRDPSVPERLEEQKKQLRDELNTVGEEVAGSVLANLRKERP